MAKKAKKEKIKKPFYKKVWFWVVVVLLIFGITGGSDDTTTETENEQPIEKVQVEENANTDEVTEESPNVIQLVAGEQGEYGQLITMSAGTDLEEQFYVYYLPKGTYNVTNDGEYLTQVSVYKSYEKNEETGYDEYTEIGDILMLDVGASDTIEIPEGWFVEIQEPAKISLVINE